MPFTDLSHKKDIVFIFEDLYQPHNIGVVQRLQNRIFFMDLSSKLIEVAPLGNRDLLNGAGQSCLTVFRLENTTVCPLPNQRLSRVALAQLLNRVLLH